MCNFTLCCLLCWFQNSKSDIAATQNSSQGGGREVKPNRRLKKRPRRKWYLEAQTGCPAARPDCEPPPNTVKWLKLIQDPESSALFFPSLLFFVI
ncbi:hypothetical protein Q8A67_001877 [Cirrhinus molitorella]|uniref:Uncharacterized protein n=1 Tax=Cirrhinus molitorella TaxID=172907 RepID=A0AA88TW98_9TELE|nr:hypothetical protein Q8A67_001877 [Cirrhinus molitorella]